MKNRVIVKKTVKEVSEKGCVTEKEFIDFYLKNNFGETWLFQQPFSKGVYDWFKDGRAEREILNFAKWERNKRLNDTIQRIPREIKYVSKYIIDDERAAWGGLINDRKGDCTNC